MKHIRMTRCLLAAGVSLVLLLTFGVEAGTVVAVGVALLCPLMMVFCIGHMASHGGSGHHAADDDARRTTWKAA